MFKKILVPLDGSHLAEAALPYARLLAQKLECEVDLLQVIGPADEPAQNPSERNNETAMRRADHYLSEIAKTFAHRPARHHVKHGSAAEIILDMAGEGPDTLIVMASHGRTGIGRWLLGSVAEKILRASVTPLLLIRALPGVPGCEQAAFSSILVPLDGSKLAEAALEPALDLARLLQTEVVLMSAYEIPATAYYRSDHDVAETDYIPSYGELVEALSREARVYIDAKVRELRPRAPERIRGEVLEGPAAERVIDLAHSSKGSLIAMCSHGRSGLRRWVLGSVAEKIARHSDAPVLIVRGR